ncbi:MAG: 30S ribosomal protein S16 [Candidatus Dormibacteraeota bacterium]|uniref:Small ribosomal subunit protein bS16 n=1 Tax=Candidatus Aeolococcus gillhamiae TaxID=3127015 RepID=A0A934JWX8_9BACT|nr:30S ribosomal protein S16 [Candidatus Dormibacteraeota bacterium]
MVKIRLKRMGAKKRPFYRLVVADSRSPRDGRFIELLGFYDPLPNPAKVQIDADKVREWIGKGARPSDAARALLVEQGILAKIPRTFKPAPEPKAAAASASETPGAPEEVDAVPAEAADRPVTAPVEEQDAEPTPQAEDGAAEAESAP